LAQEDDNKLELVKFVPHEWATLSPDGTVWLTLYRAHAVDLSQFGQIVEVVDLTSMGVRVICIFGALEYPDTREVSCQFEASGLPKWDTSKANLTCKSNGLHLAFMTPFTAPVISFDRRREQEHVSAAVALFAAFCGRLIVFEHLADLEFSVVTGRMSPYTRGFEHPGWNQSPEVRKERFGAIRKAANSFGEFTDLEKHKIHLSLRWFGMAQASVGVDAFLKYWIALETLAMRDTKVRPINDILSKCYKISAQQSVSRFHVGKLFGLRGEIVHKGMIKRIDPNVIKYLEAIYLDVLLYKLGIPCEERAASFLHDSELDVSRL